LSGLIASRTDNAILSLDGSRSACEWGEDPDSPPGTNIFGPSNRAVIRGGGTAGNANNSYWLSDPNNPLTGFPVIMGFLGPENGQQFLRTRITHQMVAERLAATDGLSETPKFDLQTMKALMYSDRVYGAEVALDDTLDICDSFAAAPPEDVTEEQLVILEQACTVLAQWDRKASLDSRGTQVFYEYWRALSNSFVSPSIVGGIISDQSLWLVDFDPADPINTPRGIDQSLPANIDIVGRALITAGERLTENGVAFDAPWGEVQTFERNGVAIPFHGGLDAAGTFSTIKGGLQEGGYTRPNGGNSYIQVVTWDESECPIADTILTHSQSSDPASPHYGDQSLEYSAKRWVRFPFCEEDIVAAQIGETLMLEAPRVFPDRPDPEA
jgi:acyl-homoserine-lactone acylase